MKFIIKPADNSLFLILEARQYQEVWRSNSRTILAAIRKVSGLEFQQRDITALVTKSQQSTSGSYYEPMQLAGGDSRSAEFKLLTIIHELLHRLLHGNALGLVSLGLVRKGEDVGDYADEMSHRHVYLFMYDVVVQALGKGWKQKCYDYESRYEEKISKTRDPHKQAWEWAMRMSVARRQRAIKILASQAVTREEWDKKEIKSREPNAWFRLLRSE